MAPNHLFRVFLICCLPLYQVSAQVDFRNFPLDTFRLPDINRKALTGRGSLSGQYRGIEHKQSVLPDQRSSNFSPNMDLDYSHFFNTRALQVERSINLDQSFRTIHNKQTDSDELSQMSISSRIFYSSTMRRYNALKFFQTELSGNAFYGYDKEKITEAGVLTLEAENEFSVHLDPTIGFGHGRLEPVSTVAMAMFILKDAEDLGLDLSTVRTEDIYQFAGLMTEVNNRRIFDSRRMRIAELRDLYSFMLNKGWVLQDDPGYFTVLTDNWIYSPVFSRQSGKRWSYLLKPEFIYSYDQSGLFSGEEVERKEYALNLIVDFRKYHPVDLYKDTWHSHTATLRFADNQTTSAVLTPLTEYAQFTFENRVGQSWFPNTRTSILGSVHLNYSYYRFFEPFFTLANNDQHLVNTGASLQANYFLSYRTQLTLNGLVQYGYSSGGALVPIINGYSSSLTTTGFNAQLSASLFVAIF